MTRQQALLGPRQAVLAREKELRKLLAGELAYLHDSKAADARGDSADLAFEAGCDEVSSRLAELDARELSQIERVLARWQRGTYGMCEGGGAHCQRKIPLARLKALPYATLCIHCEREQEKAPDGQAWQSRENWAHVHASRPANENPRLSVAVLETTLPSRRWR